MKVKVSTEATEELIEAAAWYELEVPGLGDQLIDTFEQATIRLSEPKTHRSYQRLARPPSWEQKELFFNDSLSPL